MLSWLPENVSTYGKDIDSILYLIYYITTAWFFLALGSIGLSLQPLNAFITVAAILLFVGQLPFVVNFFWSLWAGKKAVPNPWQANTLECTVPSPPPHANFEVNLVVCRSPYEYSSPEVADDWLPRDRRILPEPAPTQ